MENEHRNRQKRETAGALLGAATKESPQLLLVEDVHWADRLTLAHLAALAGATGDNTAMLVVTTRVAGDPLKSAFGAEPGQNPGGPRPPRPPSPSSSPRALTRRT